jgi:RNA polymerase sigma-70 factor (ECF subfamily)
MGFVPVRIQWTEGAQVESMQDFVEQVERHKDEFYRYIRRTAWDAESADDIFSAAVLAAWENRDRFTPGTNFRAWMYRIITNKCFVANRVTMRTPAPLDEVREGDLVSMEQEAGYDDVLANPEEFLERCGDEVYHALSKLSAAQRACLMLRGAEKFSYKEIADLLNIPLGTVMTHLSRGRARVRKELLEYARAHGYVRGTRDNITRFDQRRAGLGGW